MAPEPSATPEHPLAVVIAPDSFKGSLTSVEVFLVDSMPQPGALCAVGPVIDANAWADGTTHADSFATYWFAYSYYDPANNMESPLGPLYKVDTIVPSGGASWTGLGLFKGYTNIAQRPTRVRLYRSEKNDSTYLYSMFETTAQPPYTSNDSASMMMRGYFFADSELVLGLDTLHDYPFPRRGFSSSMNRGMELSAHPL